MMVRGKGEEEHNLEDSSTFTDAFPRCVRENLAFFKETTIASCNSN